MTIKLPDPVTKCNDCGKFVKQSVLKEHKMEHLKVKSQEQEQEIGLVTPSRPKPCIRLKLFKKSKGALDDENNAAINPHPMSQSPLYPREGRSCWNVDFGAGSYVFPEEVWAEVSISYQI